MYGRNLYMVLKDKRLYSILAWNEEQALKLEGEILDTVYLGIQGDEIKTYWWDWDNNERWLK